MAKIRINSGGNRKVMVNAPGKPSTLRVNQEPFYSIKTVAPWGIGGDTKNQRIPAILTLSNNRTLLLWQQENINYEGTGDGTGMRVAQMIVSFNPQTKEITPGEITVFDEPQAPEAWVDGLGFAGHTHLGRITKGANAGRIIVVYNKKETTPSFKFGIFTRYSDDEAETWSSPVEIYNGVSLSDLFVVNGGSVIEIPNGPNEGRLVFPYYHYNTNIDTSAAHISYSDDGGITWSESNGVTVPTVPSSEVSLAWSWQGKLVMSIRNDEKDAFTGTRWFAISDDGGTTLNVPFESTTMQSTNCQAASIQVSLDGAFDRIAFSTPTFQLPAVRYKGRIYFSGNAGQTWGNAFRPAPSNMNFGYSALAMQSKDTYCLAFENNTNAPFGFNVDEGIKIVYFNNLYVQEQLNPPVVTNTPGAQSLFDVYETRVLADGGVITDEAYTLETIQWALDNSLHTSSPVAISAQFGVKANGSTILKLYSLFDVLGDMDLSGTSGNCPIDLTRGFARIHMATTSRYFKSQPITLSKGKTFAIAVSGSITPGNSVIRIGADGDVNSVFYATLPNQLAGVKWIKANCLGSDNEMIAEMNTSLFTDNCGFVLVGDIHAGVAYALIDGEEVAGQSIRAIVTQLGALADYSQIEQPILLGARKSAGAYPGSSNNWINEYWAIDDLNFNQSKSLSLRLARYKE